MTVSPDSFDFHLPPERVAQHPLANRDQSRLLILDRKTRKLSHHVFSELTQLLTPGDLLVTNNTRVVPARFFCRRATGGRIEGLFLRERPGGQWEVLLKGAQRCKPSEALSLDRAPGTHLQIGDRLGAGRFVVSVDPPVPAVEILETAGATPLPPYIRRDGDAPDPGSDDRHRYQTVFAEQPGAVAAPTAGLHFTPELLAELRDNGIQKTAVTLHVGLGTFSPVKVEDLREHPMHTEWYELPAKAAGQIQAARAEGRRVLCVGTTSVRVIESVCQRHGRIQPDTGETDLFLYPPADFGATDALITNFHLPRSTLLMLVAAFCAPGSTDGIEMILTAYEEAIRQEYRFYSYGDAMLIV